MPLNPLRPLNFEAVVSVLVLQGRASRWERGKSLSRVQCVFCLRDEKFECAERVHFCKRTIYRTQQRRGIEI